MIPSAAPSTSNYARDTIGSVHYVHMLCLVDLGIPIAGSHLHKLGLTPER